jgi:hypothetical protein
VSSNEWNTCAICGEEVTFLPKILSNCCAKPAWLRDAPGKIRTCDLCLRRAALYPLSYGRAAT